VSASDLLTSLKTRGFTLAAEGTGLKVTPASRLTQADRQAILNQKGMLRNLLLHPELTPDERERFDERAAIREHLGKQSRVEAEKMALAEVSQQK
jgi:hypothetical protein